ncbi:MAG TPA: hypothetical protein VMT19_12255 [Thermoanaerobaculaceae bacterium]|nr:hypothetical protein [Thermoanaerobaculaceae bacterium]
MPDTSTARCTTALDQALTSVPFYRRWRSIDPGPSRTLSERLTALPVLSKRDLRTHVPHGFAHESYRIGEGFSSGEIELVATSGTAADRVAIVWHQRWWDRSEREASRLHRVLGRVFAGEHREAVLTSPVCAGNLCHVGRVPMEERMVGNLLFLNQEFDPTAWDRSELQRMAEELGEFGAEVIEADPAYLAILARWCAVEGVPLRQPQCIVLTYEFPSRVHTRQIARAFPGVPLVSSYGSTETGHVFTRCEEGLFHENTATCHAEIQPLSGARGDPTVGRILVTTLDNPWFTLVRFDVGDLARLHEGPPCACGRAQGLTVAAIEGRVRDVTFDGGGRAVSVKRLDDALAGVESLLAHRIEQHDRHRYLFRYVAEPHDGGDVAESVPALLRGVYGADADVAVRREATLAPEQSGKFRLAGTTFDWNPEELFA